MATVIVRAPIETGIDDGDISDGFEAPARLYDLMGRPVSRPRPGGLYVGGASRSLRRIR